MKRLSFLIILLLIISIINVACNATPDEPLISKKNGDEFIEKLRENNDSNEAFNKSLTQKWTTSIAVKAKNIPVAEEVQMKVEEVNVDINADIYVPLKSILPVYKIEPSKITQIQIDSFLDLFGEVDYRPNADNIYTKTDYENFILSMQQYLAIDLQEVEDEAKRNELRKQTEEAIEKFKQYRVDAPDSIDDSVKPIFTTEYLLAQANSEHYANEDELSVQSEEAQWFYERTNTEAIDVKWKQDEENMMLTVYRSDEMQMNNFFFTTDRGSAITQKIIQSNTDISAIGTTYEEAEDIARNVISALQLDYLSLAHVAHNGNEAYAFFYTRNIEGINETYCSNKIATYNRTDEPWPYENLCIEVDDKGLRTVRMDSSATTLGDKMTESAPLLSFDEVKNIITEQLQIGNIDFSGTPLEMFYGVSEMLRMNITIDDITLGYMRVKLADNSGQYAMIPVWDIFGGFESVIDMEGYVEPQTINSTEKDSIDTYRHSFLTVNAIDGTVIDRSIGY